MRKYGYILHLGLPADDELVSWMKDYGCDEILKDSSATEVSRPSWRQLLDAVSNGDEIVVASFSNAMRSVSELACFLDFCFAKSIRVISISDKVDSSDELFPSARISDLLRRIGGLPYSLAAVRHQAGSSDTPIVYRKSQKSPAIAERQQKIVSMYTSGYAIKDILSATGLKTAASVFYTLKKHSIPLRKSSSQNIRTGTPRTGMSRPERRHEQVKSMSAAGYDIPAMSRVTGYSPQTIRRILEPPYPQSSHERIQKRHETVLELYAQKHTIREVSSMTGYTIQHTYHILRQAGVYRPGDKWSES